MVHYHSNSFFAQPLLSYYSLFLRYVEHQFTMINDFIVKVARDIVILLVVVRG